MLPSLVRKTWRDDRRAIAGWSAGIAGFTAIYTSFYSQFKDVGRLKEDALPQGMRDFLGIQNMTSPAGYLEATVYSLIGPLLIIMCAVTLATRSIARPEEDGGMELLLTTPISRRGFALQRLTALAGAVTAIAAIPWLLLSVIAPATGMDVPAVNIAAASVGLILLAWTFAGIAFLVGAITGRRGTVLAIAGTLAVATYILRALAGVTDGLGWIKWLSPFHYFIGADPLRTGFHPSYLLVLVAVAVGTAVAGVLAFDRRDVGV